MIQVEAASGSVRQASSLLKHTLTGTIPSYPRYEVEIGLICRRLEWLGTVFLHLITFLYTVKYKYGWWF